MKRKNQVISALPALKPVLVVNKETGEVLTQEHLDQNLTQLITHVKTQSKTYYETHKNEIVKACETYTGAPQPEAFARAQGWNFPTSGLPREVKAKSRIERLTRYHLVQTSTSHTLNPNPHKREPGFGLTINLGSVDAQMAGLQQAGNQLILSFKCWSTEYELYFNLPSYLQSRSITKYSLPTIRWNNKKHEWVFNFAILEEIVPRLVGKHSAGIDLGRAQPYTMVVVNKNGSRVAGYTSSNRLHQLNSKRERLLVERKHILNKLRHYETLNYSPTRQEILRTEAARVRGKITRLGNTITWHTASEVTKKLAKHEVSILNMEDLRWVTGARYGSRWNHSAQQEAITHTLSRTGIRTRKVNPKNTSQACSKCGTTLIHNSKKRTVWCSECKSVLDRDYNAALNIVRKTVHPTDTVGLGTLVGSLVQSVEGSPQDSVLGTPRKTIFPT